jgi:hypothetical protein
VKKRNRIRDSARKPGSITVHVDLRGWVLVTNDFCAGAILFAALRRICANWFAGMHKTRPHFVPGHRIGMLIQRVHTTSFGRKTELTSGVIQAYYL